MHISAINNSFDANKKYCRRPSFSALIKDRSAAPIIKKMSKKDILEFQKIEKRLSRTKFWDMKISSIGNKFEELKFEFIDKRNKHGIITDGIYPYDRRENAIMTYSIIYGPENISTNRLQSLKFKSSKRAEKVYNKYIKNLEEMRYRNYNLTPIENLKYKETELNMLEEASHFEESDENVKYIMTEMNTKNFIGNDFSKNSDV